MTIYSAADMGTYEEFLKLFKEGDQNKISSSGRSLLFIALCNTKSKERSRIANFLINKGADVKIITEDGMSMFLPLFSYGRRDIIKMTILCKFQFYNNGYLKILIFFLQIIFLYIVFHHLYCYWPIKPSCKFNYC